MYMEAYNDLPPTTKARVACYKNGKKNMDVLLGWDCKLVLQSIFH